MTAAQVLGTEVSEGSSSRALRQFTGQIEGRYVVNPSPKSVLPSTHWLHA